MIAYRGRLLDLAGRSLAAELAVVAAAAAAYRGIDLFLEPRVPPGEAGLWAQRLTSGGMHTCGGHMAFSVCDLLRDNSVSDALAASLTTCADHTEIRRGTYVAFGIWQGEPAVRVGSWNEEAGS